MVAMFCMNYFLVFCLLASGTCELIETGQFFKLNENKDSEDSSVPGKNNDQILNEDFFKCRAKEEECSVVSKQNKKTEKKEIWTKIDYTYELATGRHAEHSSTFRNPVKWEAGAAVDGKKGHIRDPATNPCTSTNVGAQQWWMVTFDKQAVVYSVTITSLGGKQIYFNWMKDFSIKVGKVKDHKANGFCKQNVGIHESGNWLFKCDKKILGRYLYIVNNLSNAALCFCEVEVCGSYIW